MDDFSIPTSPPSLKQKLKNSHYFSCCFPHCRPPSLPSSFNRNPTLIWVNYSQPNFVGNGLNWHKKHSSTEFYHDLLNYSLNFDMDLLMMMKKHL
ncbi:hypothetical protein R3W88_019473 [Solanum pinnatisectum]|uniref:Uncharacterized protein n=1 Tax=Solanum pinnatisectum TaxID=50273 RepID=A0AAV9KJT9_9SOLN|nr:hypothetical protein R3W88_019473 [Solanum pinnatisectum]